MGIVKAEWLPARPLTRVLPSPTAFEADRCTQASKLYSPVKSAKVPVKPQTPPAVVRRGRTALRLLACGVGVMVFGWTGQKLVGRLSKSRMIRNEHEAVHVLKEFTGAQALYRRKHHRYARTLPELRGFLNPKVLQATRPENAYHGYYFVSVDEGLNPAYEHALLAIPARYEQTGLNSYFTTPDAVIYQGDDRGAARTRLPSASEWQDWIPSG